MRNVLLITALMLVACEPAFYTAPNSEGTENNEILDWQDEDENSIWTNITEGERWYDLGYDQIDDSFESGCFNDENPYGNSIICWNENEGEDIACSYENILEEYLENSSIDDLDDYLTNINGFDISNENILAKKA